MGLTNMLKDQFIDVIDNTVDMSSLIVVKYVRKSGNNEIKQGAKLIVRESQSAIFVCHGKVADLIGPGTHTLDTDNLPILSKLEAWKYGFNSPIQSDLYFVSTKILTDNKWGTKNPFIIEDERFGVVRIRGFGTFGYRVSDPILFMKEVFGTQQVVTTADIETLVNSIVIESVIDAIGEMKLSVTSLAMNYREIGDLALTKGNEKLTPKGISFQNVNVENISIPEEVEKYIDEQSGVNLASGNMQNYAQWNQAKAMRDAAQQSGGLAGIGAGFAFGGQMAAATMNTAATQQPKEVIKIKCPGCGALNDEHAKFCGECGNSFSSTKKCPSCGANVEGQMKFCSECGTKMG